MTRTIRNLFLAFIVLIAGGTALGTYAFLFQPDRNGVWLLGVLMVLAAIGCALAITFINTPTTTTYRKQPS